MQATLNTSAFGKNDIRGIFPTQVNSELFFYVARGYAKWAYEQYKKIGRETKYTDFCFSVAMDARLHSPELKVALVDGFTSIGVNILDIGMAPTPLGYYSEYARLEDSILFGLKIHGALIITASHNPSEYNGLKMTFAGLSLNEGQIQEIKAYTLEAYQNKENAGLRHIQHGILVEEPIVERYIEKISNNFGKIGDDIKVVVDSANATGGVVAPKLYRELGCEVVELFSEPDGNFPNHHPNPSDEKTLNALKQAVLENKADCGIAFDGDSDRIGVVTPDGKAISGDKLLLIYALDLIKELAPRGEKLTVVSEVKCSQVLYDTINAAGGNAVMWKTGHGYIKAKMRETKALLAGEMSGHVFFKDRYYGFDDAIYAGCRLIEIIAKNKKNNPNFVLQDLLKPFEGTFLLNEGRIKCPNEIKKPVLDDLARYIDENPNMFDKEILDIITIDGLRIIFDDGFAIIRQSNTEPVFTLRFESKTSQAQCEHYRDVLVGKVEELKHQHLPSSP